MHFLLNTQDKLNLNMSAEDMFTWVAQAKWESIINWCEGNWNIYSATSISCWVIYNPFASSPVPVTTCTTRKMVIKHRKACGAMVFVAAFPTIAITWWNIEPAINLYFNRGGTLSDQRNCAWWPSKIRRGWWVVWWLYKAMGKCPDIVRTCITHNCGCAWK